MRKLILLCGILTVAAVASPGTARAYGDAPWCVKASIGEGVSVDRCEFRTFEHCAAERPSWGNSAFCIQNSRYLPYWQGRQPVGKATRKKSNHSS